MIAHQRSRLFSGLIATLFLFGSITAESTAQVFPARNVTLRNWIPIGDFAGAPTGGNDCWGYTSPSGREYALMGLSNSLAVVEIIDPSIYALVEQIPHSQSLWADIKVYQDFAYVVNETGGGMDVVDLSNVDSGIVTLVQRVTANGLDDVHNIAIDTQSGFLYLCIPNINSGRLVAFDLADPANPVLAGMMTTAAGGSRLHDAQIVTFTAGPYAGKQICFGAGERRGVDIYDVTDKANMFRLSRTTYPGLKYSHQCWLSEDRQYLYVNDELDEASDENVSVTRTLVFDVSDLSAPVLAGEFSSGLPAIDHNLYVHNGFLFQANYTTGLRIFNTCDPINPVEVGFFDTMPESDGPSFDGAWSQYPFFPSGTVIVSDMQRGLFVLDVSAALGVESGSLTLGLPDGVPSRIDPGGGSSFRVVIGDCNATLLPGTELLHYNIGAGEVATPLVELLEGTEYEAIFPAIACGTEVSFYVTAQDTNGTLVRKPGNGTSFTYRARAALNIAIHFEDDMENGAGWTVSNISISDGGWDVAPGVPAGGGNRSDPISDYDGSGKCWLTDNVAGNSDVDGGPTMLTSTLLDASNLADPHISYARWLNADDGADDRFTVELSNNDGLTWTQVESVDNIGVWEVHAFRIADFIVPNDQMRLRFSVIDNPNNSVVEAALDALRIYSNLCIPGDTTGDNVVNVTDLLRFLALWGNCPSQPDHCPADFNQDGFVNVTDLLILLSNWG